MAEVSFSQTYPERPLWDNPGKIPDTAGIFPGEDLVVLKNDHILRNSTFSAFPDLFEREVITKYGNIPVSVEENFLQIYVRSDRGARMSWQLQVSVMQQRTLMDIRLRNRKPDGSIMELNDQDIRYVMNQTSKTKDTELDYSYLPVPGVDAGDILEIYSTYYIPGSLKSDEIYFNFYYPVLYSKFTYEHSPDYEVTFMKYNFENAEYKETRLSETAIAFEFFNLPGLYNQQDMMSHMELPFLVFRIDSIQISSPYYSDYLVLSSPDWKQNLISLIQELMEGYPGISPSALAKPDNFFKKFTMRYPGASKIELALEWHKFLNDSIALRFINQQEEKFPMEHWLEIRATDRSGLVAWYMHYFNYLDIGYTIYLSRELAYGYLDSSFVYSGPGMSVFFGIDDGTEEHLLFPPYETESYAPDEYPSNLRGSIAVGLPVGRPDPVLRIFMIPFHERNDNWKNRNMSCKMSDLQAKRITIDQRSYFSGEFGRSNKIWNDQLSPNTSPAAILENILAGEAGGVHLISFDVENNNTNIYQHSLKYECDNFLCCHSDSSFSLRVKDVSSLDIHHTLPYPRIYGYYYLLPYYNTTRFYLNFAHPVEILSGDTITDEFRNLFGSMHLKALLVNDSILLIETHYSINTNYLSAENYGAVEELAARTEKMMEKRLFFRYRRKI